MSIVFTRRKTLVCLVLVLNLTAARAVAIAADPAPQSAAAQDVAAAPSAPSAPSAPLAPSAPSARPAPLVPLYASFASLQALDAASTLRALNSGAATEANPIMRGIVGSPAGLLAVKAGITGLTIFSAEKLWKKNRTAAVVMMLAVNGGYAAIVAHNYSVAR